MRKFKNKKLKTLKVQKLENSKIEKLINSSKFLAYSSSLLILFTIVFDSTILVSMLF